MDFLVRRLGPKARGQASPGQRPGKCMEIDPALKGRNHRCRPFRAGLSLPDSQGVALGWLVSALSVLSCQSGKVHNKL